MTSPSRPPHPGVLLPREPITASLPAAQLPGARSQAAGPMVISGDCLSLYYSDFGRRHVGFWFLSPCGYWPLTERSQELSPSTDNKKRADLLRQQWWGSGDPRAGRRPPEARGCRSSPGTGHFGLWQRAAVPRQRVSLCAASSRPPPPPWSPPRAPRTGLGPRQLLGRPWGESGRWRSQQSGRPMSSQGTSSAGPSRPRSSRLT